MKDETKTHHLFCNGCSGFFCGIPGVAGSSYVSGSGGFKLPSMLSDLVICMRAVIASRLGMFLYPTGAFFFSSSLCFSTFSAVRGSPTVVGAGMVAGATVERGEEVRLVGVVTSGEAERVVGALTAIESAAELVNDT